MTTMRYIDTGTVYLLEAGETKSYSWKHIADDSVWSVNAVPQPTFDSKTVFPLVDTVEVTRVWRETILTPNGDLFTTTRTLFYSVKNTGKLPMKFKAVLSLVAPDP